MFDSPLAKLSWDSTQLTVLSSVTLLCCVKWLADRDPCCTPLRTSWPKLESVCARIAVARRGCGIGSRCCSCLRDDAARQQSCQRDKERDDSSSHTDTPTVMPHVGSFRMSDSLDVPWRGSADAQPMRLLRRLAASPSPSLTDMDKRRPCDWKTNHQVLAR